MLMLTKYVQTDKVWIEVGFVTLGSKIEVTISPSSTPSVLVTEQIGMMLSKPFIFAPPISQSQALQIVNQSWPLNYYYNKLLA